MMKKYQSYLKKVFDAYTIFNEILQNLRFVHIFNSDVRPTTTTERCRRKIFIYQMKNKN